MPRRPRSADPAQSGESNKTMRLQPSNNNEPSMINPSSKPSKPHNAKWTDAMTYTMLNEMADCKMMGLMSDRGWSQSVYARCSSKIAADDQISLTPAQIATKWSSLKKDYTAYVRAHMNVSTSGLAGDMDGSLIIDEGTADDINDPDKVTLLESPQPPFYEEMHTLINGKVATGKHILSPMDLFQSESHQSISEQSQSSEASSQLIDSPVSNVSSPASSSAPSSSSQSTSKINAKVASNRVVPPAASPASNSGKGTGKRIADTFQSFTHSINQKNQAIVQSSTLKSEMEHAKIISIAINALDGVNLTDEEQTLLMDMFEKEKFLKDTVVFGSTVSPMTRRTVARRMIAKGSKPSS